MGRLFWTSLIPGLGLVTAVVVMAAEVERPAIIPDAMPASVVPDVLLRGSPLRLARILGPARDFANNCQGCHGPTGISVDEVPQLHGRVGYFARLPEGRAYLIRVPNVAQSQLDSTRIAAMMNWVLFTFSKDQLPGSFKPYTADEVQSLRAVRINPAIVRARLVAELTARQELSDPGLMQLKPYRNY